MTPAEEFDHLIVRGLLAFRHHNADGTPPASPQVWARIWGSHRKYDGAEQTVARLRLVVEDWERRERGTCPKKKGTRPWSVKS